MNELDLLMKLREEVPLTAPSPAVRGAVLAAIEDRAAARRPGPARSGRPASRIRAGIAAALALAVGAAVVSGILVARTRPPQVIAWNGRPMAAGKAPGAVSLGVARTEAELVAYASRAATMDPGQVPGPHEWVFVKTETAASSAGTGGYLFGPPDQRFVSLQWVRVDRREYAGLDAPIPATTPPGRVVHGRLEFSQGGGGTLGGWKNVSYRYLSSLPTDPGRLESVILAGNRPGMPWYARPASVAVFNAIRTLLEGETEGVRIPPELAAAMYRVLQRLPGVRFERATDLAGRTGLGLYLVIDGWYKQELVIDPRTYLFMGDKEVAIAGHTMTGTDGTRRIAKGHVLGWEALLESVIVRRPGQLP